MRQHRLLVLAIVAVCAACSPSGTASPAGSRQPSRAPASASPVASPVRPSGPLPSASTGGAAAFDPSRVTPQVTTVVSGLRSPTDLAHAGDGSGRIFVAEQEGQIRIVRDGSLIGRPFVNLANRIASGGERGLLGIAFHPDYPDDPRVFVNYTDRDGDTVIASLTVTGDPDVADPESEIRLLRIDQPFPNHNGGGLVFGPDGMLYIAMGDGGSAGDPQGNGQRLDTLLAKILRIDVDAGGDGEAYGIPADNPFVGVAGARPEIWLTGLRNPWRIRFDRATGDLWIGDVGQGAWEEIDVVRAGTSGQDFGWNVMEGFDCYKPRDGCDQAGLTMPVAQYGHELGCAVIGGVVARGRERGALDGGYLFGDACSDNLWLLDPVGDERREPVVAARIGRTLSSIGEGEDGTVYATSLSDGELVRISAAE